MPALSDEQVTFRELIQDKVYRAWLKKIPRSESVCFSGKPWRIWVQRKRGGPWARKDFEKYSEAYRFAVKHYKDFHDLAICSKVDTHRPPVVRAKSPIPGKKGAKHYHIPRRPGEHPHHEWCPHCRRPTIFTWFTRHHSFGNMSIPGHERRCTICGIRLSAIRKY